MWNKVVLVKWLLVCRDIEIFLNMPVIILMWTDFENLVSPNNKICSREINFLSVGLTLFDITEYAFKIKSYLSASKLSAIDR